MTIYELKSRYLNANANGHYFDRDTLKFFGERLSDMRVLQGTCKIKDISGRDHIAYCVSSLQRNHPAGPRRHYAYFDAETYDHIIR